MLTATGCKARQARLWSEVPETVEWLLIADPRHVLYLSNFLVQPISFSRGERGLLLLERQGKSTLIADNFTIRSASSEPYVDAEVVETWYDHKHSVINRDHALLNALKSLSEKMFGRPGAVEAEWLPVGALEILGLDRESHSVKHEVNDGGNGSSSVDLGTIIRKLRRKKEADEVNLLKQCMRATDAGQANAREIIQPGMTEFELFREVQAATIAEAGQPAIVYGDFRATNAQSPKAGGLPTDYVLKARDLFILDFSCVINGYRSDFTNTLAVGEPTKDQQALMETCQKALASGEASLKAGALAKDVYQATSKPLEDAGYDPLGHHAGHGIGLAHPESPILVPESDDVLVAGDVVTLEPGLYIEGVGGIRIENNYLITESGSEKLNSHTISLT